VTTVLITALPTIASLLGVSRVVRGVAIAHPVGDPALAVDEECVLRGRIVERALDLLETSVESTTVWEVGG
jgi:betaine reductase